MHRFRACLVAGRKAPYTSWTFIEIPAEVAGTLGRSGPIPVRGTLAGTAFRGTASRSGGVLRVPILRELLDRVGIGRGDEVEVALEPDLEPRPVLIPEELQAVLDADPGLAGAFEALPPSHRRAWASHVGDAKRADTRVRRARQAIAGIQTRAFPR